MSGTALRTPWPPVAALVLAAMLGCVKSGPPASDTGSGAAGEQDAALATVAAMIEEGRTDEALQRLGQGPPKAETLYLMGRAWARKAQTAPLPTPPPAPSPLPRGASLPPPPPTYAPQLQAIGLFEKAIAARPEYPAAHVALAELLAPHALRRQAAQQAPEEPRSRRRRAPATPAPLPDTGGVDVSVDRVVRAYQFALQGDPASTTLPEALIGFGIQSGRLDAAESGHRALLERMREKPEPFVRYGDFLVNHRQDQEGAIEQYRQALIWRPDDDVTRSKIAEIHLTRGIQNFSREQFAMAEQEFAQAGKWITDRTSPQGRRLDEYMARLREIRRR